MYANIRLKPAGILIAVLTFFSLILTMCGFIFTSKENTEKEVTLPILMYHSLQKDSKAQGTYVISPDDFERDIKGAINCGINAIWYTHKNNNIQYQGKIINNLTQLKEIL